ncbi:MAG: malate synthase G [Sphingosinicella sp.]
MSDSDLTIDPELRAFVEAEALPGTGIDADTLWNGLAGLVEAFGPVNRALLAERDRLQSEIDARNRQLAGQPIDPAAEREFLARIGYLAPEPPPFTITTEGVDAELATIAGPQLVVPADNARYAVNAANARWGSLYDALYGTDVLGPPPAAGAGYDRARGAAVIARAKSFLDEAVPLAQGSHAGATGYRVEGGRLVIERGDGATGLAEPDKFAGFRGDGAAPAALLLVNHGLHIELAIDRSRAPGRDDPAGIAKILLEAAVSTIVDCEDSVAAVDAADKVRVYRNWLGLMKGSLTATFDKGGKAIERRLAADRTWSRPGGGGELTLPGRSLLLVRNVGHHIETEAVRWRGEPIPETLLDALVTPLCALHGRARNSRHGSIYFVKPKLHGPDEVALAVSLFERVEPVLGLAPNTIKIGVMDEERRTSANLAACIHAARERIVFVNTGFLDRTGDEIHTAMEKGPVVRKAAMKASTWLEAYEDRNVGIALACGFAGKAQIGKGMWAAPDRMAAMLAEKGAHPASGASTAWVPSPTAATLHALHYHRHDVAAVQARLSKAPVTGGLEALLTPPLLGDSGLSPAEIAEEIENNCQSILGYVVRWIEFGIGCSKVPDIHGTGLMEDRATLRIGAQHLGNWLRHGLVSEAQAIETLQRMARVVDAQNAPDPAYAPMAPAFDGPAFLAARDLILSAREQPNGYTEYRLHHWRRLAKAKAGRLTPSPTIAQ